MPHASVMITNDNDKTMTNKTIMSNEMPMIGGMIESADIIT